MSRARKQSKQPTRRKPSLAELTAAIAEFEAKEAERKRRAAERTRKWREGRK